MANAAYKTVDEYIATFPPGLQEILRTVRTAILEAAPGAQEAISYQVPAYRLHGILVYFGGFKKHYSLFAVSSESLLDTYKKELSRYEMSKGTIKFPLDEPVPVGLIGKIVRHRVEENRARETVKRTAKK
jgi:uncharacterized protein YdhG (YjbR/CyaY superfamily)